MIIAIGVLSVVNDEIFDAVVQDPGAAHVLGHVLQGSHSNVKRTAVPPFSRSHRRTTTDEVGDS